MSRSPRDRRLIADAEAIGQLVRDSSILQADGKGSPPNQYRLRFSGRGLSVNRAGNVVPQDYHELIVELGAAYPRLMPTLHWKTPIFHPNISSNGVVCLGGYGTHWVPSLTLAELCNMLWDMIRMKNYDVNSPYNREAAAWIRDQTVLSLPLDLRPLRNRVQVLAPPGVSTRTADADSDSGIQIIETGIEVLKSGGGQPAKSDVFFIN